MFTDYSILNKRFQESVDDGDSSTDWSEHIDYQCKEEQDQYIPIMEISSVRSMADNTDNLVSWSIQHTSVHWPLSNPLVPAKEKLSSLLFIIETIIISNMAHYEDRYCVLQYLPSTSGKQTSFKLHIYSDPY